MKHVILKQKELVEKGIVDMRVEDIELKNILDNEVERQQRTLSLVASCCAVNPKTLFAMSSALVNITAEGSPQNRYHAGCKNVDLTEIMAIERACKLFGAKYANVQPHSASSANYEVMSCLLNPGDTILGMGLDHGGHLSHGSKVTFSGTYYNAIGYGTTADGIIDYDDVKRKAQIHRPKMIICGATAYSRIVNFEKFREIANETGSILMADISHIAGLVVTGRHPSPINLAHVTTTCTHKQLTGPRGGVILSGTDVDNKIPGKNITFRQALKKSVFPWMQGAPAVNLIAAKAATFKYAMSNEYDEYIGRIRAIADMMVNKFKERGYDIVGNKSQNHTILIRLNENITGAIAESALEECSIIVNKNRVPGETRSSFITSGLRIGTGSLAQRFVDKTGCDQIVDIICDILNCIRPNGEKDYIFDEESKHLFKIKVEDICKKYPIVSYMY